MAESTKVKSLKMHVMPDNVHKHFVANGLINENELYLVEDEVEIRTDEGTVLSMNADYAEVAEWSDGNPNNEDRIGYFVSISSCESGISMRKATATSDVRGVTMRVPGFAANAGPDKFDSDNNLLPKFNYVGFAGFVPVIDNGSCSVNGRCVSSDDGTAIPSNNNMGYQVIERIDTNHVLILVEPGADTFVRIKNDVEYLTISKEDKLAWITENDLDAMIAGTYDGGSEDDGFGFEDLDMEVFEERLIIKNTNHLNVIGERLVIG